MIRVSIVVSAYDNWHALDRTLLGYRCQREPCDELIVAEDSEFAETAEVVARHRALATFPILHLTQPDLGFRKCTILNRAIAHASGDWLVFTDADCVPRDDLVAAYRRLAAPGRFVAGGSSLSIPAPFHRERLTDAMIESQQLFDPVFLAAHGVRVPALRLTRNRLLARMLDRLTPRDTFVGCNSGAWRSDLLRVRGFDESMAYGGEDRNLGYRLNHAGVRGVRARYSIVWVHLDHARSYAHADVMRANRAHNAQVRRLRQTQPRHSALAAAC
ncbi:MAG TPA: glycosyltransferase [Burkholderiaceae bacterium]|nr:glycosyltransferase [Burkholderiaceae bacterium]